jgi:hypothetical protein
MIDIEGIISQYTSPLSLIECWASLILDTLHGLVTQCSRITPTSSFRLSNLSFTIDIVNSVTLYLSRRAFCPVLRHHNNQPQLAQHPNMAAPGPFSELSQGIPTTSTRIVGNHSPSYEEFSSPDFTMEGAHKDWPNAKHLSPGAYAKT